MKTKELELVYPVKNRFLRFYGDVVLLLGSIFTHHGLKFGGVYEYEFDELED